MKKLFFYIIGLFVFGLLSLSANASVFFNFSFSDIECVPVEEYVVERVVVRPVRYRYYREYYPEEYCYDYYMPRTYYRDYYYDY